MGATPEFIIADGVPAAALIREIQSAWRGREGYGIREHPEHEGELVVLDSFDGLLHQEGLSCTWEEGRLVVLDRERGEELATVPRPEAIDRRLTVGEIPPGRVRRQLARVLELRALLPLARVRIRVRPLDLLDGEQKTVVRLRLERPEGHPARIRLLPLRGYAEELERACAILEREPRLETAPVSLSEEALRAAGHPPEGIRAKVDVPLQRGTRADEAARLVLLELLGVIEANVEGTVDDLDPEFLHDLRVSVRRSRAVQRELAGVFPPLELARFRGEFKWLQQATGEARDLDVYVHELEEMRALVPAPMRPQLDPLEAVLRERRERAQRETADALRDQRATTLLADWRRLLERLPSLPPGGRSDAARPVEEVAGERIAKVYRRMVRMGSAIGPESPAEDYHELRKKGKELRYLLELFGAPLYPDEVVSPMVKSLKALQDVLGRHQDREVQQATLRALTDEVGAREGGQAALLAMGAMVLRLADEERAARAEFAERFASFAAATQRKLVKETFR